MEQHSWFVGIEGGADVCGYQGVGQQSWQKNGAVIWMEHGAAKKTGGNCGGGRQCADIGEDCPWMLVCRWTVSKRVQVDCQHEGAGKLSARGCSGIFDPA